MQLPHFLDNAQTILQENAVTSHFSGDTVFSFPAMLTRGDRLMDSMFLYRMPDGSHVQGGIPYAWVVLDAETGDVALFAQRTAVDFVPPHQQLPEAISELTLLADLPQGEYVHKYKQLYEVYDQLRQFAFQTALEPWQQNIIYSYKTLFLDLAYTQHLPFYQALAPEFFAWLGILEEMQMDAAQMELDPLTDMNNLLLSLSRQFEDKINIDGHKELLFSEMHEELREYKNGLLDSLNDPLVRDIIKMIEDIDKTLDSFRGEEPTRERYDRFFTLFDGVRVDLEDMLYRCGIEPFSVEGEQVDIQRQQILSTIPTEDPDLDKTVAERFAKGWIKESRLVRPERIAVYVLEEAEEH